jgi:hypothetical protein
VTTADDRALPRLEAADVELGLRYLADCRVLVLAEPLEDAEVAQALAAAAYHGADVVLVAPPGRIDPSGLGERVTLLERPLTGDAASAPAAGEDSTEVGRRDGVESDDELDPAAKAEAESEPDAEAEAEAEAESEAESEPDAEDEAAFAGLVAAYALHLDRGVAPEAALRAALDLGAWEPSPG